MWSSDLKIKAAGVRIQIELDKYWEDFTYEEIEAYTYEEMEKYRYERGDKLWQLLNIYNYQFHLNQIEEK